MASTAEHILQVLEEAGVEYVFGIPGGGTSQIFALMHGRENSIKPILVQTRAGCGNHGGRLWPRQLASPPP